MKTKPDLEIQSLKQVKLDPRWSLHLRKALLNVT